MEAPTTGDVPVPEAASYRDWSELPLDALAWVFGKLGAVDILMGASYVCHSWLDAAKVPELWRSVDMSNHVVVDRIMGTGTIDKTRGGDCTAKDEAEDGKEEPGETLFCIGVEGSVAEKPPSPGLKVRFLKYCSDVSNEGFSQLEDLTLLYCDDVGGRDVYEATGKACRQLRCFTMMHDEDHDQLGREALRVAAMHELRSLTLQGCDDTNNELVCILDGCPQPHTLSFSTWMAAPESSQTMLFGLSVLGSALLHFPPLRK
ncbi:hypothetical protein HU200_056135 [Digitaria exilis]|uniref:F-box domain-containing protein n=1 Tax=Digitaria exilis TaxID=1010633 RepID=A0A835E5F2_9POAL|nr:hypothetical protein HU200_056135 [Digitaria exilis]